MAPNKRLENLARVTSTRRFETEKQLLMDSVDNHPISQELNVDGNSDVGSEFLGGRSGNLRAFIGFYPEDDPVGDLKALLMAGTKLSPAKPMRLVHGSTVLYRFTVITPTLKELFAQTPYPDPGPNGSWLRGIEQGVPGLRYYFFSTEKDLSAWSKSGSALQMKRVVKGQPSKMKGREYIREILRNFRNRVTGAI